MNVDIYEFSTGIKFDSFDDGGWISRGFTGEYMNCTIDPIPYVVERSISNREFRIAEGTASKDPAVVARVVGESEESWSVVAIVSRGEDEGGRGGSFYRYFLAQGADKIPHILTWLEEDKQTRNPPQLRVFNPLDVMSLNQEQAVSLEPLIPNVPERQLEQLDEDIPTILDNKIPNLSFIHALTLKKVELESARGNYIPVAWAFNVEAVEQIKRFTIVRAASDSASELLNRAKASAATVLLPLELFDEQAVKSAIKGIANSGSTTIKTEHVITFADAVANQAIEPNHWYRIFDSQGANNPLRQKIYTPQMIKLLTLRALAIPATFLEYRKWRTDAGKTNNVEGIAQEFEHKLGAIKNQLPQRLLEQIDRNIEESFGVVLANFLNDNNVVSIEVVTSLLKEREGLWGSHSKQFITNLHHDLDNMQYFINPLQYQDRQGSQNLVDRGRVQQLYARQQLPTSTGNNCDFNLKDKLWQNIREDIYPFWNHSYYQANVKYLKFAELFERINPKTALIFYHISQGEVPAHIFKKLSKNLYKYPDNSIRVYGVTIHPHRTNIENLLIWLFESKGFGDTVNRLMLMIIAPSVALLGFGLGLLMHPNKVPSSTSLPSVSCGTSCTTPTSSISTKVTTEQEKLDISIQAIYSLVEGKSVQKGKEVIKKIGIDNNSKNKIATEIIEKIDKADVVNLEKTPAAQLISIKNIIDSTNDKDRSEINKIIEAAVAKNKPTSLSPQQEIAFKYETIKTYLTKNKKK